ncbi:hypothetical protein PHIN3_174 [Sinorhizobium phage phiN3]|uniref:Uncharacterized protein n=1 Tax=Sinorhizobium phage phiN3 TaxID=1647405 RepID=A0A0F6YPE0_9CAUD|nr:hypothetical protein AVT40_gp359 [Sinorhizobium phage phiN3]AKF13437.1 hypothetical protein PHIN3_174 [Sinorhizobium phage phiN3]
MKMKPHVLTLGDFDGFEKYAEIASSPITRGAMFTRKVLGLRIMVSTGDVSYLVQVANRQTEYSNLAEAIDAYNEVE